MKAKIKYIIIIAIAVILLAGAVVALKLTAPVEEEEDTSTASSSSTESLLIYDKNPDDVGMITVTNEYGTYEIHRYGYESTGYVWCVPEYIEAPVDTSVIDEIVEEAATLTAQKTVVEEAEDLSIYGLSEPQVTYKVEFDDSAYTVKEICIGNSVPGSSTTNYMCISGENTVYTVKRSDVSSLFNDKRDCINKVVYTQKSATDEDDDTDYSHINKMTVSRQDIDYDIVIEYDTRLDDEDAIVSNSSSYRMTSPVVLDLNPDKCTDVITDMFGLTASDFAVLNPTEEDLTEYGFDDPYAVIDMDLVSGALKITVGNEYKDEEGNQTGYYAVIDGIDVIYIFDTDSLPWVTFMPLDITTIMITTNYVYDITSMEVVTADTTAEFKMTGTSSSDFEVTLNGEEVDSDAFRTFYQFILRAPSEQLYFGEVEGDPYAKVVITTASGSDTIEFYPIENRRTIISLNGAPSFTCKTAYAERLAENILKFENGEDIITNW